MSPLVTLGTFSVFAASIQIWICTRTSLVPLFPAAEAGLASSPSIFVLAFTGGVPYLLATETSLWSLVHI